MRNDDGTQANRAGAIKAIRLLDSHRVSLTHAVEYYINHTREVEYGDTVKALVEPFISTVHSGRYGPL